MTESTKIEIIDLIREEGKLSIGRVGLVLSFLYSSYFWMWLRVDAPSTLITIFTLFATYVLAGKTIQVAKEHFTTVDGPGE